MAGHQLFYRRQNVQDRELILSTLSHQWLNSRHQNGPNHATSQTLRIRILNASIGIIRAEAELLQASGQPLNGDGNAGTAMQGVANSLIITDPGEYLNSGQLTQSLAILLREYGQQDIEGLAETLTNVRDPTSPNSDTEEEQPAAAPRRSQTERSRSRSRSGR